MFKTLATLLLMVVLALGAARAKAQETPTAAQVVTVAPGDTWAALAWRYGTDAAALQAINPHMNRQRQPTIGSDLALPGGLGERTGRLIRLNDGGLLQSAARSRTSPWALAFQNRLATPFRPTLYRPLFVEGADPIRELPPGFLSLEVSQVPGAPGQALGLRGRLAARPTTIGAWLDVLPVVTTVEAERFLGLVGTGAFFDGREPELTIRVADAPVWTQPWAFAEREWEYQELTLTGEAAEIDQQARDDERARLRRLWTTITPGPRWEGEFRLPIADYLLISANYGARRSYNGGPYQTYHEGVDFSAYAGTPVYAPAAGTVALAERLYVRGGAVIVDHGLGLYSGFYHLSAIHVALDQVVQPGDLLGEVGTTGLSTGNHLHWDLLVNGVWVDAAAWQAHGMACWTLEALNRACAAESN